MKGSVQGTSIQLTHELNSTSRLELGLEMRSGDPKSEALTPRSNGQFFDHLIIAFQQEAHGPWLTHLSEKATAGMQLLCNNFPVLSLQP